jgi:gluconokinase
MTPAPKPDALRSSAIVGMGVSGSGKSSVGEGLAKRLGLPFRDADSFHPQANIDKMTAGIPLTDADRWPWLDAIGAALRQAPGGLIVACSALRRVYRDRLRTAAGRPIIFVWLAGSKETIAHRLDGRRGHFMPASLLDSQFATLEPPGPDEGVIRLSIERPLAEVIDTAATAISRSEAAGGGDVAERA